MYALVCDRIKPKEEVPVNTKTILSYATEEEICVFEKVQQKINEQNDKDILPFDDGHVGLCEGMAIYINKEAPLQWYIGLQITGFIYFIFFELTFQSIYIKFK